MNFLSVIITYNPSIKRLEDNLEALMKQTKKILLIDNGSENFKEIKKLNSNLIILSNKKNLGIAKALNQALNFAYKNGYEWILTLDQDSIISESLIKSYLDFLFYNKENKKIGILAPKIIDNNIDNNVEKINKKIKLNIEEPLTVITSGSLINVKIAKEIGGFLDFLFIDSVDFEFCLRMRINGYKIFKLNNCYIDHKLGNITQYKFFFFKIYTTNHNPVRRYYQYRNSLYVHKKYRKTFKIWALRGYLSLIKTFFHIILFEKSKIKKIRMILKGIKDYFNNSFGPLDEKDL